MTMVSLEMTETQLATILGAAYQACVAVLMVQALSPEQSLQTAQGHC
jgi:hypothetical protein